jgi:hypothetical protein
MVVAELLEDERLVGQLDAVVSRDDREFESTLRDRELALMADDVPCAEIAFRLAVVRATRDALLEQGDIRALPTASARSRRRGYRMSKTRRSERWRSWLGYVDRALGTGRGYV